MIIEQSEASMIGRFKQIPLTDTNDYDKIDKYEQVHVIKRSNIVNWCQHNASSDHGNLTMLVFNILLRESNICRSVLRISKHQLAVCFDENGSEAALVSQIRDTSLTKGKIIFTEEKKQIVTKWLKRANRRSLSCHDVRVDGEVGIA